MIQNLVEDFSDIYRLTKDQLLRLEGFAEKSATQLLAAIEQSKTPNLACFLFGLGIRHVGSHVAKVLANKFGSLSKVMAATKEILLSVHEIGPETAQSVVTFFAETRNRAVLKRMMELGVCVGEQVGIDKAIAKPWKGKLFVITGTLEGFTRQEASQRIEELGGRVMSSVSKKTTYVLVGADPGSKLDAAKMFGIPILDEEEFSKLLR